MALFSESTGRVVVAIDPEHEGELTHLAEDAGVPVLRLGTTGGDAVVIEGQFEIPLAEASEAFEGTLPSIFG